MCIHSGSTPATVPGSPVDEPIPAASVAERQRRRARRKPSARPPAAHAAGGDPALARHQRDHDEPDDAVHDRDPRAPLPSPSPVRPHL